MLCFVITKSHGQFSQKFQEPKAPQSYLFEKYGYNVPSEYNGRINIPIMLHKIEYGNIEIPLTINYASNGIRVDEEASIIGLGWYMNTGMVTQIVMGKDDLHPNVELKLPDYYWAPYPQYVLRPYPGYYWENPTNPKDPRDPSRFNLTKSVPNSDSFSMIRARSEGAGSSASGLFYPHNYTSGFLQEEQNYASLQYPFTGQDVERDIFKASFFGHNLMFYKHGTSYRVLNNEKYKIEFVGNNSWVIITPSGIKFEFEHELVTKTYSGETHSKPLTQSSTGYKTHSTTTIPTSVTTQNAKSWKITKISDPHGNTINFNYTNSNFFHSLSSSSGYTEFKNTNFSIVDHRSEGLVPGVGKVDGPLHGQRFSVENGLKIHNYGTGQNIMYQEKSLLSSIVYGNTLIEFNHGTRLDIKDDKYLDNIKVKYKGHTKKEISLNQSYFNSSHTDNLQKRLRLDGITIDAKKYHFEYETELLPNKNSLDFDFWGYYNGMNNTSDINNPFRLYENTNYIPTWVRPLIANVEGMANRSAHPNHAKAGMLKKVVFPTGGYSEFEYELNSFSNIYIPNYDNKLNYNGTDYGTNYGQNESKGYGLRIKEIKNFSEENILATKTRYTYKGGKHIEPIVAMNEDTFRKVYYDYGHEGGGPFIDKYIEAGQAITCYFSNIYQTSLLGNGSGVGYDSVVKEEIDRNNIDNNGKTISYFSNVPDKSSRGIFGQGGTVPQGYYDKFAYSIRSTNQNNGVLLKQVLLNQSNDTIQKTKYTYNSIVPFSSENNGEIGTTSYNVKSILVGKFGFPSVGAQGGVPHASLNSYDDYIFFYYPLKGTKMLLSREETTQYFNGKKITTTAEYDYNNNYNVTNKTLKDSNGVVLNEERVTYVSGTTIIGNNFTPSNNSGGTYNILDKHKSLTVLRKGKISNYYNYTYVNNYRDLINIVNQPKNDADVSTTMYYNKYDTKGNLVDFNKEGEVNTLIVWGYDETKPIAKIINAKHNNLTAVQQLAINSAKTASNNDIDQITEEALISALSNLRAQFSNLQVTTYTYDPLIGVTSITDARGETMYYEYDSSNRLAYIKDANKNILKEYKYNYKN